MRDNDSVIFRYSGSLLFCLNFHLILCKNLLFVSTGAIVDPHVFTVSKRQTFVVL